MEQLIAKMRADWGVVAEARRGSGEWSEQDEADIGAAIKDAIARKDADMIACWSRWLADLSAWAVAWALVVRGSEARMREQARVEKERREKKAA